MLGSWDVLPTFAELAGISPPKGLDGISIVPTLMGRHQPDHPFLYWTWGKLNCIGCDLRLPAGRRAEENATGTLVYVHDASSTIQAVHPSLDAPSPSPLRLRLPSTSDRAKRSGRGEEEQADGGLAVVGPGGFAVVSGKWKGIVPRCRGPTPSAADLPAMLVFHLEHSASPETESLHNTPEGQKQRQRLLDLVITAGPLTCLQFV